MNLIQNIEFTKEELKSLKVLANANCRFIQCEECPLWNKTTSGNICVKSSCQDVLASQLKKGVQINNE